MKIVAITMVTNPDYRQDPWRESIAQMLLLADQVVVVCGRQEDVTQIKDYFTPEKVEAIFLHWPQPEWNYLELPWHLNHALMAASRYDPDWIIKLDIDNFIHENDIPTLKAQLAQASSQNKLLASLEKYQFHAAFWCYEKGKMPIAINSKLPTRIMYGQAKEKYTDLCQPIISDGPYHFSANEVNTGSLVSEDLIFKTSCHVWNYDYTFKTKERSQELLYQFDRAHAKFWKEGYNGRKLEDITPESAFGDFLKAVDGHMKKSQKSFLSAKHPRYIQKRIREITPEEFGSKLWNIINF